MEDILKRLLAAEKEAEDKVEAADAARKKIIQDALDEARRAEMEFEQQAEARRKPFLATAEEGAQRRIAELEAESAAHQRMLRERAASNEEAAVEGALALILGQN
jgi:V/A-type H+-transporting ATPase subunit G/H